MGWLFTHGQTLKEIIVRRTTGWETTHENDTLVKTTCMKHCYRGGAFSGVLWTVWERTFEKDGDAVRPAERFIGCDLLKYQTGYGWGYKDQEESMHPYQYSCPLAYLTVVPVACEAWREGVRAYHQRQREKRATTK